MATASRTGRSALIAAAGIALAVLSGASAAGNVLVARGAPEMAAGTFLGSGRAYTEAAQRQLQAAISANDAKLPDQIPPQAVALAREGFVAEPLAAESTWIIALDLATSGKREEARALMRKVPDLTKRESPANLWLAEDYGLQGDNANLYRYLDMALRTSANARPVVLPQLVAAVAEPKALEQLSELMASRPPWSRDFWREATRRPELAPNLSQLRVRLGDSIAEATNPAFAASLDESIMDNLVDGNQFDQAAEFYQFLSGEQPAISFANTFEQKPPYPPFDWQLVQEGEYGASIISSRKALLISAVNGARGSAVRRLLKAAKGRYRLSLENVEVSSDDAKLVARTRCADGSEEAFIDFVKAGDTLTATWEVATTPCAWYWLELQVSVPADRDPVDIFVDSIRLTRSS